MSYLFAAYAVFWAFTFAFMLRVDARQRQLEKEIHALSRVLERED